MNQLILDKLHQYASAFPVRTFTKGHIITHAGEEPAGVHFLISGMVEQYDITPEGNHVTVNIFKPPAFYPMSWAINKTPNSYFYAAMNDVELRLADAESTVAFLQANPDVMFDLLSRVYKGTDALLQQHVITVSGIAASRLIFALLIEAYRFGAVTDDKKTRISTKHNALAARSGLARETVSRELHKLEKENLILLHKDGIELDVTKLEKRLDIAI